jgi:hypothetical protein
VDALSICTFFSVFSFASPPPSSSPRRYTRSSLRTRYFGQISSRSSVTPTSSQKDRCSALLVHPQCSQVNWRILQSEYHSYRRFSPTGSGRGRFVDLHFLLSVLIRVTPTFIISRMYSRLKPSHRIFRVNSFPGRRDTDIQSERPLQRPFSVDLAGCAGCPRGLVPLFSVKTHSDVQH